MKRKDQLDEVADKILGILDRNAEGLTTSEKESKWFAFNTVVSKVGDKNAKPQSHPRVLGTPRVARRQA